MMGIFFAAVLIVGGLIAQLDGDTPNKKPHQRLSNKLAAPMGPARRVGLGG